MEAYRSAWESFCKTGGWTCLKARALFRMSGSDRKRYLNGQITQSVDQLASDETRYACALDAKGGLVTDLYFREMPDDQSYLIDVPIELRETAFARLERYMIADDVALDDLTGTLTVTHVLGMTSQEVTSVTASPVFHADRFGAHGLDIIESADASLSLADQLSARGHAELPDQLIESIRVDRGIPVWGKELLPSTLPHEAGITERAVSFTKGCYIGQEVVSRIQSIGSPSRRLCLISPLADDAHLHAGDELRPHDQPEAKPCGTITSVAFSFTLDKIVALAYLKRGFHEAGALVDSSTPDCNQPPCPATIISTVPL